jgi:hypothetical protein
MVCIFPIRYPEKSAVTYFGFGANSWFVGKLHLSCFKDCVFLQDGGLRLVMAEGLRKIASQIRSHTKSLLVTHLFAVEALIKYDTHTPDVDFGRDFGWIFAYDEALRRQVPIGAGTLRGQVHAVVRIVVFFVHHLGQTKVCNLYLSANVSLSQQDIAW